MAQPPITVDRAESADRRTFNQYWGSQYGVKNREDGPAIVQCPHIMGATAMTWIINHRRRRTVMISSWSAGPYLEERP